MRLVFSGLALGSVLAVVLAATAAHQSGLSWMGACCAETDCRPIAVAVLGNGLEPGEWMVRVGTAVLSVPQDKVKLSSDGKTYWCANAGFAPDQPPLRPEAIRCVFYVVGG